MANFQATFSKQFSNNCQTLVVTDTSNYGFNNNDEHREKVDFTVRRSITLRDIFGNTLAVQNLDSNDTATFDISLLSLSQLFLNIGIELAGTGFSYEARIGGLLPCIV